jgi:dGTPase
VITESHRRFVALKPKTTNDVRALGTQLCGFSVDMAAKDKALKEFLWANMYRHAEVNRMSEHAQRVVRDLFGALLGDPGLLPESWRKGLNGSDKMKTARRVADYIAGMTDRFAQDEHTRLFEPRK